METTQAGVRDADCSLESSDRAGMVQVMQLSIINMCGDADKP